MLFSREDSTAFFILDLLPFGKCFYEIWILSIVLAKKLMNSPAIDSFFGYEKTLFVNREADGQPAVKDIFKEVQF